MLKPRTYSTNPASVTTELSGAPQGFSFNYFKLIRILVCSTVLGFLTVFGIIETSLNIRTTVSKHTTQSFVVTHQNP